MPLARNRIAAALFAAATLAARALQAQSTCPDLVDPPTLRAQGATLRMAPARYSIGGQRFETNVYNGRFVAPTLVMHPGEPLRLQVVNDMRPTDSQPDSTVAWTNQHYHGLVVTPNPDGGDNVTHVRIGQGERHGYDFPVPAYHTQGMFWYHPHPHEITGPQVAGGLGGALMVGSILEYFPQYRGVREHTLLIRDMSFNLMESPQLLNINGNTCTTFRIAPNERQLWHIGNFGANHFVNLKLEGMSWMLLAMDGDPLPEPVQVDSLWIPPGSRAEVIVTGPPAGTRTRLYSAPFLPRDSLPVTLGWLASSGRARSLAVRTPAGGDKSVIDTVAFLRRARDLHRETFTFSFPGETTAAINDSIYQANFPPISIPWGQVQEWTLVNNSQSLHTFHIHQTDFLVMSVNGTKVPFESLRDNIPLGVHTDSTGAIVGDTVVVRFVFEPIAAGPFVFHCHVLQHEDEGMMGQFVVVEPGERAGERPAHGEPGHNHAEDHR